MKVGIDGQFFGASTGIGRYTSYLVGGISKWACDETELTIVVGRDRDCGAWSSGVRVTMVPPAHRLIWANLHAPWVMHTERFDVYHAVDNLSLPLFWPKGRTRCVLTIHDLIPLLFPQSVRPRHRYYFRFAIGRLVQTADAIIVDAESTKRAILERFKVSENKITVIYLGVDRARFHPIDDEGVITRVRERYGVGSEPFILFVGNIEPRKNLSVLIRAFAEIVKSSRIDTDIRLVIAGSKGPLAQEVLALPSRLGLTARVIFPGVIGDEDLPALYSGASLFVFPSLYEGFGFPVLEAMSCGTPVISSNTSSLPEVAGDAAVLVHPTISDLRDAILKLLTQTTLRDELRQRGFDRVRQFSWDETARRTWLVYKKVCSETG